MSVQTVCNNFKYKVSHSDAFSFFNLKYREVENKELQIERDDIKNYFGEKKDKYVKSFRKKIISFQQKKTKNITKNATKQTKRKT